MEELDKRFDLRARMGSKISTSRQRWAQMDSVLVYTDKMHVKSITSEDLARSKHEWELFGIMF